MIRVSDLDLTEALAAGTLEFLAARNVDVTQVDAITLQHLKQSLLEEILPMLPYVIKQVGQHAWDEGHRACDRDWAFTADLVTPDEDRQPETNPYDHYPLADEEEN